MLKAEEEFAAEESEDREEDDVSDMDEADM